MVPNFLYSMISSVEVQRWQQRQVTKGIDQEMERDARTYISSFEEHIYPGDPFLLIGRTAGSSRASNPKTVMSNLH